MLNKNDFWDNIEISYPLYPTVRHRKRFVVSAAKKFINSNRESFIFDYGCGTGDILKSAGEELGLHAKQLGGSDMSKKSIAISKNKIKSLYLFRELYPRLPQLCDAIICSEVIEHASEYNDILAWIYDNLKIDGIFILSTQGGKMHKIDEYSGHVQTFEINKLCQKLEHLGYKIIYKRKWGWPLFTLQKYITNFKFESIKSNYLEGNLNITKKTIFNIFYLVYFLHNYINKGPQLYIIAKK